MSTLTGIVLDIKKDSYIVGVKNPFNGRYFNLEVSNKYLCEPDKRPVINDLVQIDISIHSKEKNVLPVKITASKTKFLADGLNSIAVNKKVHVFNEKLLLRTAFAMLQEGLVVSDYIEILYKINSSRYVVKLKNPIPDNILKIKYD